VAENVEKFKFVTEGADSAARDFEKVASSTDKVDASSKKAKLSFADMGGALIVAKAAYAAFSAVILESVKLYAEVDAEQGRIVRNLEQMGLGSNEAKRYVDGLNKSMAQNLKYGVGIKDQTVSYRKLLDATKDRAKAEEDLALAIDIQADGVTDLAGATDILAKARQGDAGALAALNVLTKDEIAALSSIKDEATRTAVSMQILTREFQGAGEKNLGLADKMAGTTEQINAVKIATGELVSALAESGMGLIDKLLLTDKQLKDGKTTLELFAAGMRNFAGATKEAATELGKLIDEFTLEDYLKIMKEGGILTEGGRQKLFAVISRADTKAAVAQKNAPPDVEGGGGGFVGPELSNEELIRRGGGDFKDEKKAGGKAGPLAGSGAATDRGTAEALAAIDEVLQADMAAIQEQRDWYQWLADEKRRIRNEDIESEAASRNALDSLTLETRRIEEESQQITTDLANERNQTRVDEIAMGADFVASGAEVVGGFIKNEKAKLAFEAIAAGARAAVSFALAFTPPPVGGPQFFPGAVAQAAAAAAMAAKAGAGGGGGVASKPSGSGASAGPAAAPSAKTQESLSTFGRGSGGVFESTNARQINIYSTFGPSPEDARRLKATIAQEERRQS
jgi:hypothetical protein